MGSHADVKTREMLIRAAQGMLIGATWDLRKSEPEPAGGWKLLWKSHFQDRQQGGWKGMKGTERHG